jgi:hypothetical protein
MDDAERFRLLGKYQTPRFRYGRKVLCEVVITGMTDSRIPWPVAKRGRGRHSLVIYQGLAKAVRRKSNQPIAHWWGVDPQTVSKWQRLLGVKRATEGTSRLLSKYDKGNRSRVGCDRRTRHHARVMVGVSTNRSMTRPDARAACSPESGIPEPIIALYRVHPVVEGIRQ